MDKKTKIEILFDRDGLKKDFKLAKRLVKRLKEVHVLIAMLQYYEPKEFSIQKNTQKLPDQASLHKKRTEYTDEEEVV